MLVGLAPVIASHTRLVVLGSFPGEASLAAQLSQAVAGLAGEISGALQKK